MKFLYVVRFQDGDVEKSFRTTASRPSEAAKKKKSKGTVISVRKIRKAT